MVRYLKTAFTISYIRNVVLLSLLTIVAIPVMNRLLIYPLYENMSIRSAEKDAVQLASSLINQLHLEKGAFEQAALPDDDELKLQQFLSDFEIYKLRVFNAAGTIVYSTQALEVGQVNTVDYFRKTVTKGTPVSTVVRRQASSLEGDRFPLDVAEIYVPVVSDSRVTGVFEIYYDLTTTLEDLRAVNKTTNIWMLGAAVLLVLLLLVTAAQGGKIILEKEKAEKDARDGEILSAVIETAGGVCHEFNQPLQVILGYCELLQEGAPVGSETHTFAVKINRQVMRIKALTLKLMGITRFETKPYIDKKIIDLEKSSSVEPM